MRRTSTCAWARRPRASWPCVASRRLSCITTRWTAARSWSGPDGSARSSSFSGRAGGSVCVRSIWSRSSSRRSCCSKRRIWSRVSGSAPSSRGWSVRRSSARRMRWTSTPSTPEPSPRRAKAAMASRARSRIALSSPSRIAWIACSRRLSRSICSPPVMPSDSPCSRTPCAHGLLLDGAEEEPLEHEVEHAPVVGRLGQRRRQRLAERRAVGPLHLVQRGERVEQLGRPDRDALGPQRLAEVDDPGRQAHVARGARPSRTPTRSATTSRSVRCLTMIDIV